jgi:HD-GYP domain-containing protein (c-di-GMP phosphodiesterase class II)
VADARLCEIVGSLSLATEHAAGVAPETASRAAILAVAIAEDLGVEGDDLSDLYYAALLRYIGCTSYAHETSWYGAGDDIGLLRELGPNDGTLPDIAKRIVRGAGRGTGARGRVTSITRVFSNPKLGEEIAAAHCAQAVELATTLGAGAGVTRILDHAYERFDGKGAPKKVRGEKIPALARIMHVAYRAAIHLAFEGRSGAIEIVHVRSGKELDPGIAEKFLARADALLAHVSPPSVWDQLLAAEPGRQKRVSDMQVPRIALAFGRFVDLKSPFTLGHSEAVARACETALQRDGADERERERGRLAGLLHDLGHASIQNGIWEKAGALNVIERERVEQHPYQSERILARSPILSGLAKIVGMHHERLDGSGYHRGVRGAELDRVARVLQAAEVHQALREERAHRAARAEKEAADALAAEAKAGRLDANAVAALLGSESVRRDAKPEPPSGLSQREAEVLVLLARGMTNKQIGKKLFISPRTVGHHVAHIYDKTGVRTRAAAALFAVQHELA